jgi:hypothetical protein
MEGDRQGVGTDKEGGKTRRGDTGRGPDREKGHREGGQTGRGDRQGGYGQGGDTDRMRGGHHSWDCGWGVAVIRASLRVVVVVGTHCVL